MGAGASVEHQGKIFQVKPCGCIYSCTYEGFVATDKVEMMACCYACLSDLRKNRFDFAMVKRMAKHTYGQHIDELTLGHAKPESDGDHRESSNSVGVWMTQTQSLDYAKKKGIRCVEEFLYNTNILERYGWIKD